MCAVLRLRLSVSHQTPPVHLNSLLVAFNIKKYITFFYFVNHFFEKFLTQALGADLTLRWDMDV